LSSSCNINKFDIHVSGTGILGVIGEILAWLFNTFFKGTIEEITAGALRDGINGPLNQLLQTLPVEVPVGSTADLNVTLVPPNVFLAADSFSVNVRGMTVDLVDRADIPPYTPTAIPRIISNNEMVQIFIGDWVPNSASWVFTHQGKLNFSVTEDLMKGAPLPFNTASWNAVASGLTSKYPNWAMTASLGPWPGNPPVTYFSTSGVTVSFFLGLDIFVINGATKYNVFNFQLNVTASAAVTIQNGIVYPKLIFLGFKVLLLNTLVGPVDVAGLNAEMSWISSNVLVPLVNNGLSTGVKIPMVDGVQFVNPSVQYGPGWLGIMSNIAYVGAPQN